MRPALTNAKRLNALNGRQARIELMSNRNSFYVARARDHFPRQNGDGVHAGLDFILASNNGTALYDPTA